VGGPSQQRNKSGKIDGATVKAKMQGSRGVGPWDNVKALRARPEDAIGFINSARDAYMIQLHFF
jgi:hypothetical protein